MYKRGLPDFPSLFETIAKFLDEAEVPKSQLDKLHTSKRALDCILRSIYAYPGRVYPCLSSASKIPRMDSAYRCLAKRSLLQTYPEKQIVKIRETIATRRP